MKKAVGVMLLFALTVALNTGIIGTIPQIDDNGIAPQHDEYPITEIYT